MHLRDIAKIIEAALTEERRGDWLGFAERLQELSGRVARHGDIADFESRREGLVRLRAEVEKAYLESIPEEEMSANESVFERHIQNSNTDPQIELNGQEQERAKPAAGMMAPERKSAGVGLKEFLTACPTIVDYARGGVKNWRDVIAAAELVRSMLGISPSAWAEARKAMGDISAAIVVAAILERAEEIRSPGGYLRDLTKKAEKGRFSVHPMLNALRE